MRTCSHPRSVEICATTAAPRADHARPSAPASAQQKRSAPLAAVPLIARVPCPAENALCDKGESAARRGLPYKSYRTAYAPRGLRLPDGAHRANRVPTRKEATHLLGASAISSAFRILDEAFSPPKAEEGQQYTTAPPGWPSSCMQRPLSLNERSKILQDAKRDV